MASSGQALRRVLPITVALAAVALVTAAALPTVARADDGDGGSGQGWRRHGRWDRPHRVKVVRVLPPALVVVRRVVVPPPVVVVPPLGYVFVGGHYEERAETHYVPGPALSVWVPPAFGLRWANGRFVSVELSPGHYEARPGPLVPVTDIVRIWVPGRWAPVADALAYEGYRE